ncbi:hypothetical protein MAR_028405, partial [Mya arenaria]
MSHNSKSYRKKLTKQTAFSCKKIDVLLRQHALASSGSQIDREDASKQDSERKSSEIASEPVSVSPTEDSTATPEQIADPNFMLMEIQKDVGIKQDYPAMGYLMLVGALITTSTVVVERVFSLMNRLCTPLRASMSQKTIEELMRVVSIGEECLTDEQLNEAIAYFGRKKDRMIVQAIMVFEALSQRLCKANIPEAVSVSYRRTLAILFTSQINVTARLFEHTNRSAENLQLRIIISNNTNKALLRYIHLLGKWREMITPCEDARVMRNGDRVEIAVESGESVIREQLLDMEHFQQGVDNIQIPLRGCDNTPLPPTVNGHHIQCWYEVQLEVTLSNDDKVDLKVPVAVIWPPKNKEWGKWKCPQWVAKEALNIDIYHTTSVLRVPQNLLSSPAFSSIPG